jgi:hypothetical protein
VKIVKIFICFARKKRRKKCGNLKFALNRLIYASAKLFSIKIAKDQAALEIRE